jgi:CheY-like chemotaxis protein
MSTFSQIIMRKVLQNLGLLCDEAENGQVAVDLMKQGRNYDLILMDKEMPVMVSKFVFVGTF